MVLYVDAVVAVTVMRVVLFVLPVCMLRRVLACESDGNTGVWDGRVVVSAWHVGGHYV